MPTYPLVKFVDSAATTATVRYDFNTTITSGKVHILPGLSLGVPELEGDPDGAAIQYGLRTITFTQRIEGTRSNAMARQSALARELMRKSNYLLLQMAADRDPVWFETYRPEPGDLSFENVQADNDGPDAWDVSVSIPAEPFALGARVSQSPVTVNNDPAAGSNPCSWTTATILGDAPAPCRLSINPSPVDDMPGFRWMISHAAMNAAYTPVFWQVGGSDGWTPGTDVSASAADATMSGGTRRTVSFATNTTLVNRITGISGGSAPVRGKYKVLVRVARSDANSTFTLRFGQNIGATYALGDIAVMDRAESATATTGHATWVDLGEFSFPRGAGQVPDDLVATVPGPSVVLQAGRTSGSGSLYLDCFALIPIDILGQQAGSTIFSEFTKVGIDASGGLGVWDGDTESFWAFNISAGLFTPMPVTQGGYASVVPGYTNVFHLLQQANGALPLFEEDSQDNITFTSSVTLSYNPRWLYLGDG